MSNLIQSIVLCAFSYFGGKNNGLTRNWITGFMPEHEIYVETCAGSAGVLLNKDRAVVEVLNEVDRNLLNFWMVCQDKTMFSAMMHILSTYYPSQTLFMLCREKLITESGNDPVLDAARYWCVRSMATMGRVPSGFKATYGRDYKSKYVGKFYGNRRRLPLVHERLQNVAITNMDMVDVIHAYDSLSTLYLIDPPYVHSTRNDKDAYFIEAYDSDHQRLLLALQDVKGHAMLCGHDSQMYDDALVGWTKETLIVPSQSPNRKPGDKREEVLWTNYKPEDLSADRLKRRAL